MLTKIMDTLNARKDISAWTVRYITSHGAQVYAVPGQIESQRTVGSERYKIDVLCNTKGVDGSPAVGSGDVTILPNDDIDSAIDQAALVASLVANPLHSIPGPADLPDVPLIDDEIKNDVDSATKKLMDDIRATASKNNNVRLTAAECFGDIHTTRLVNSKGIDAEQESTHTSIELVLQAKRDDRETEFFVEKGRRRISDIDPTTELEHQSKYTLDLLEAKAPPNRQGAVVLRNDVLGNFMAGTPLAGSVLQFLSAASSKYAKITAWEIGESVFKDEVKGDPLTVWANRLIPYGTTSNRFDSEGLPAQRVELIRDNKLVTFHAGQRYAEYLEIPATGAFGGVELPAGKTEAATLLEEPHIEIIQFSWFNPDPITGDFATEIRLGYVVENGVRTPFKGGQLIGNYMQALADVRWSAETGFFGHYLGPHTARFNNLKVSGED
ncbi:MAG TPA: metallopeptidase TldD-related protein [Anaerolineales bacterium]|nr:metallopeptidase TldD-related protein [Anaerolineales bacterium]